MARLTMVNRFIDRQDDEEAVAVSTKLPYSGAMTSPKQIRKAAMALPEVEETKEGGRISFDVRRKPFAVVEEGALTVWLPVQRAEEVRVDHPEAKLAEQGGGHFGVRVPLSAINGMHSNALVRDSWLHRAPKALTTAMADAETKDHNLPTAIGRPATRALTGAGITTLADVAAKTRDEICDLHGVGPRAIQILEQHLAESGHTWAK